ncbi:LysM peptidoglycan-binding domain-containing protein [Bacteriovoracales bacterium]|nr:LysM peptidoglycan-binding domain-containing protein [Bacteriovoracales bacterium]
MKVFFLILFFSSCSNLKFNSQLKKNDKKNNVVFIRPVTIFADPLIKSRPIEKKIKVKEKIKLKTKPKVTLRKKIPLKKLITRNKVVNSLDLNYSKRLYKHWLNYFTGKNKERFKRQLNNGIKYKKLIERTLRRNGLPTDLYYVALIESGFHLSARSSANAVGPWQFMKGTGKMHGLKINSYIDERKNIVKATEAASHYFKDLYNIFGSWELALCAYNSGEFRVINAIRRGNTRNYLELVKKKLLPRETILYVPKFAAARSLGKKFEESTIVKNKKNLFWKKFQNIMEFRLRKSFSIFELVKETGMNIKNFKALNPDLRRNRIRVYKGRPIVVYAPKKYEKSLLRYIKKVVPYHRPRVRRRAAAPARRFMVRVVYETHKVKKGESLLRLSKKFGTNLRNLMSWNRLKRKRIYIGQRLKVKRLKQYIVREGDNLTKIAKKLRTSITKIVRFNSLKSKKIFPRQKIHIPI